MLGAMGYSTSTAFFQDKSLIGMIERDGPCRWLVIYNLDGDFSSQCNQHHRTFSQFDGSLGLYGAKMNPFHSLDINGIWVFSSATVRLPRGSYILGSSMISIFFIYIRTQDSGRYCMN